MNLCIGSLILFLWFKLLLLANLNKETLLNFRQLCSQLINQVTQIRDELPPFCAIELSKDWLILHDLRLTWLTLSAESLHDLFILHPEFKNLSILLLNLMVLFYHILLHFVKSVLCCRYDILYSLFRGGSTILTIIQWVANWNLVIIVDWAILVHCKLLLTMICYWQVALAQSQRLGSLL
jgi:hypothetical protein